MKATITHEFQLSQPPARVWRALTTREAMARWLMPNDFEARLGHRFTFRREPIPAIGFDGVIHCEVLVLQPPERLEFSWKGGGLDTVVRFHLSPSGSGTRVAFEHAGFDLEQPAGRFAYEGMKNGWVRLGEALDREAA